MVLSGSFIQNNHGFSVDHGWIPSESPSNIHLLPNRATNNSSLGIQGGSFRWNLHMVPKPAVSESAPTNGSIGIFNILPNFAPAIHALHNSYPCSLQKFSEDLLIQKMNLMKPFGFGQFHGWQPSIHQSAQTLNAFSDIQTAWWPLVLLWVGQLQHLQMLWLASSTRQRAAVVPRLPRRSSVQRLVGGWKLWKSSSSRQKEGSHQN